MCVCSDNYIMKWGNQGMPKDLDQLNNLRVIFTVCCPVVLLSLGSVKDWVVQLQFIDVHMLH